MTFIKKFLFGCVIGVISCSVLAGPHHFGHAPYWATSHSHWHTYEWVVPTIAAIGVGAVTYSLFPPAPRTVIVPNYPQNVHIPSVNKYVYFCDEYGKAYPEVTNCPSPWRRMLVQ